MMLAKELEDLLKSEIPIAQTIGIHSLQMGPGADELCLNLPLQPNINHKGTLFGGSLYSAGALSCYGLFLAGLRAGSISTNNIVIAEGNMRYLKPVGKDAIVRACWNSHSEKESFFKTLHQKKKARVPMTAQILVDDQVCAEFVGQFVAIL